MAQRPIDANALKEMICSHVYPVVDYFNNKDYGMFWTGGIEKAIDEQPTIDAEPVRHGKWIYGNDFHWYTASCNRCGYQRRTDIKADRWNQWNYCPNCGCRMDEE